MRVRPPLPFPVFYESFSLLQTTFYVRRFTIPIDLFLVCFVPVRVFLPQESPIFDAYTFDSTRVVIKRLIADFKIMPCSSNGNSMISIVQENCFWCNNNTVSILTKLHYWVIFDLILWIDSWFHSQLESRIVSPVNPVCGTTLGIEG